MHNHNEHEQISAASSRALKINLIIAIAIMVVEIIGGLISNSLALIGDAGHMLVDGLALSLSLFALNIARRPATATRTFGFHRAEILAALANGTTLILLSAFIFYESYQRIIKPPEVHSPIMLAIAVIGLIANFTGIVLLRRSGHMNLNIKAAFWHIIGDTISSVGVISAAVIIMITGWTYADPIIAIIIGIIILWGAVQLVRESTDILLEAAPRQIPVEKVTATLKKIEGVDEIHDIHIWTITSGIYAMSAHLVVKDLMVSKSTEIIEKAHHIMVDDFNITHTTFQLECETCPTNNVCGLSPQEH
jgi:cobalt-zinc-cadmium efflux system protein